jgi:hypothetical protein
MGVFCPFLVYSFDRRNLSSSAMWNPSYSSAIERLAVVPQHPFGRVGRKPREVLKRPEWLQEVEPQLR